MTGNVENHSGKEKLVGPRNPLLVEQKLTECESVKRTEDGE